MPQDISEIAHTKPTENLQIFNKTRTLISSTRLCSKQIARLPTFSHFINIVIALNKKLNLILNLVKIKFDKK